MTSDEKRALQVIQGGLELLRNALIKGDPQREIEFRVRDLLAETRALADGKAKAVASFQCR